MRQNSACYIAYNKYTMNLSYYFLMILSGNSRLFYGINYKTEAYSISLTCLEANEGGKGTPSLISLTWIPCSYPCV